MVPSRARLWGEVPVGEEVDTGVADVGQPSSRLAILLAAAMFVLAAAAPPPPPPEDLNDPVRKAEYWLDSYGIRQAWQTTRGAGVRIAVIDTGVAKGPIEFEGAVVGGTDVSGVGTEDGRTPIGAVDRSHGSWVASLAAARGNGTGGGMVGVAPEADLLAVSVGFGASASVGFSEQIADAVVWAVDGPAPPPSEASSTSTERRSAAPFTVTSTVPDSVPSGITSSRAPFSVQAASRSRASSGRIEPPTAQSTRGVGPTPPPARARRPTP